MENKYSDSAHVFIEAIRTLASKPGNLENLKSYLSHNFGEWLEKYANDPENLSAEMREFANMII